MRQRGGRGVPGEPAPAQPPGKRAKRRASSSHCQNFLWNTHEWTVGTRFLFYTYNNETSIICMVAILIIVLIAFENTGYKDK